MEKINSDIFKLAMSNYTTGITIITINKKNLFTGKTVNSFASLSLDPPLVLFSLDKKSSSLKNYQKSNYIGINILSNQQKKISNHFSKKDPNWGNTKYFLSKNKIPMIKDSIVNLNCKNIKTINQGDHVIFICEVSEAIIKKTRKPLIYYNSQYI